MRCTKVLPGLIVPYLQVQDAQTVLQAKVPVCIFRQGRGILGKDQTQATRSLLALPSAMTFIRSQSRISILPRGA